MIDEDSAKKIADRLSRLLSSDKLDSDERRTAMRCHRRLGRPLRVTIFGTNPKHAISLLNLLAGQPLVPPNQTQARIQIVHSETPTAEIQLRDGTRQELREDKFREIFVDNPQKVRIAVDLPVLKKVNFMVAANANPRDLCADAEQTLIPSDFVLWAGDALTDPVLEVWTKLPQRVRDHSYLVLPQSMDDASWDVISGEFVSVVHVDPRLAQAAKTNRNGADKEGFEQSGGKAIVKVVKKEIEVLRQSALDAAQIMLIRHDEDHDDMAEGQAAPDPVVSDTDPDVFVLKTKIEDPADTPAETSDQDTAPREAPTTQFSSARQTVTKPVRSIKPVTKAGDPAPAEPQTEPKRQLRVVSERVRRVSKVLEARLSEADENDEAKKVASEDKESGEKSAKATPWSLGL